MDITESTTLWVTTSGDGIGRIVYMDEIIRWQRVEAPTVGQAWKAPVYRCDDGTEFIDFQNEIEIDWEEQIS
jgi:hypothetical protein